MAANTTLVVCSCQRYGLFSPVVSIEDLRYSESQKKLQEDVKKMKSMEIFEIKEDDFFDHEREAHRAGIMVGSGSGQQLMHLSQENRAGLTALNGSSSGSFVYIKQILCTKMHKPIEAAHCVLPYCIEQASNDWSGSKERFTDAVFDAVVAVDEL
nr:hypothetical protein [Tanacetum cinerariifolium]